MKKRLIVLTITAIVIILVACEVQPPIANTEAANIEATSVVLTEAMTTEASTTQVITTTEASTTEETTAQKAECETLDKLIVDFMPSLKPNQITTQSVHFKELLKAALKNEGFDVAEIDVQVETSYEAVGEALSSGTADVGFIPGEIYTNFEDQVDVILTATHSGLSKNSSDAKDWNDGQPTKGVDKQMAYNKSLIVAGPTEKGKAIAQKINEGKTLTAEDIKALNWGVRSPMSLSGYIYPMIYLQDTYGITFADIENLVEMDSYGATMEQLAQGLIDVGTIYADARSDYADKWIKSYGREASIWEETAVIGVTSNIYNDTISVSKVSDKMTDKLKSALSNAFISIAQSEDGKEVFSIYFHEGYQPAAASDYDKARQAQEIIKNTN